MERRLLLMTDASAGWAERFLADVQASGMEVACVAGAASRLADCNADVSEWYAGLEVVEAPQARDCVVWLAAATPVAGALCAGDASHWRAGLREVAQHRPVTVVALRLQGGPVLDVRVISTRRRWSANRAALRDHSEVMLRDWLRRWVASADDAAEVVGRSDVTAGPLGGMADVVRYGLGRYPRLVAERLVTMGAQVLGIPRGIWTLCLVEGPEDGARLVPLPKPFGVTRADPFLARFEGRDWLFFEEYDVRTRGAKGELKCAPLDGDGHGEVVPFLKAAGHLSYPQIVEHAGRTFVMPESHVAGRVALHEVRWQEGRPVADAVPDRVLMEGVSVADATLWQDPATGQSWLFASLSRTREVDHAVELHVFRLGGEDGWQLEPHPMNPVVRDCRYARCAGKMYVDEAGRLIRPCQAHMGGVYGAEVHLMNITALSPSEYRERRVGGFAPETARGFDGLHHVCRLGEGRFLVDARRTWETR